MSNADIVNVNDLTADDIDDLLAMSFEVTDTYITNRLAALSTATDTTLEEGDTVRYIGKHTHWVIGAVDGDHIEVYATFGHPRRGGRTYRSNRVTRDRVELVRKGNRVDDFMAAIEANDGRIDCNLNYDFNRR